MKNQIELFNHSALQCSKTITQLYSTSFSLGIKTLGKEFRLPVYAIYGFVRYADEIVDTFHGEDKALLLAEFKTETYKAISNKISLNPVLHSFQLAVNQYNIPLDYVEAFFYSMEMDLHDIHYNLDKYQKYIYGSAEVVGLMCLKVFCNGNENQYNNLLAPARSLGAAFQKINFLRDIKSDYEERGRTYFPEIDFTKFTDAQKSFIENDIKKDFDDAYKGILNLPKGARLGVYLAYVYYLQLFKKIKQLPASTIMNTRVRVPDNQKIMLLVQSYFKHSLNAL